MAGLRASILRDKSVRKAYRDALDKDRVTEKEVKKIIESTHDGKTIARHEIEDLRRIHRESTKLTPRAKKLLGDFLARAERLLDGRNNLDLIPMIYGRRFDSRLVRPSPSSRIWHLYLDVRIHLDEVGDELDICTDRGADRPCVGWPQGEFDEFKKAVIRQSLFWSDRFILKPPDGLASLSVDGNRQPYVLCRFNLLFVPRKTRRHRTVKAVYLDPADSSEMRSRRSLWDNRDANVRTYDPCGRDRKTTRRRGGKTYKRVTVWHELGHQLGNKHIGHTMGYRECAAGKGNECVCYGRNHKDRSDIMGLGHVVGELHADPWVGSVADHTFTDFLDWTVVINTHKKEKYTL